EVIGRLRPGATAAHARAELTAFYGRPEGSPWDRDMRGVVHTLPRLVLGETQPALIAFAAAAGLLLLITCINVANLLLVRGLAGAVGITGLAMLIFGLAPAVMTSRVEIERVLRSGTRQSASKRSRVGTEGLVAGQVALALLVLSAAGLVARSLIKLERAELSF